MLSHKESLFQQQLQHLNFHLNSQSVAATLSLPLIVAPWPSIIFHPNLVFTQIMCTATSLSSIIIINIIIINANNMNETIISNTTRFRFLDEINGCIVSYIAFESIYCITMITLIANFNPTDEIPQSIIKFAVLIDNIDIIIVIDNIIVVTAPIATTIGILMFILIVMVRGIGGLVEHCTEYTKNNIFMNSCLIGAIASPLAVFIAITLKKIEKKNKTNKFSDKTIVNIAKQNINANKKTTGFSLFFDVFFLVFLTVFGVKI